MTDFSPFPFIWTEDGYMRPIEGKHWAKKADERWCIGETYSLVEHMDRSIATHNHEFAWLTEAWKQLPENLQSLYPSAEHLRKRALIEAGFFDEEAVDCGSKAAALRVAAFIRNRDDFALVIVKGVFVLVRTAKSQSRRAMDRKTFNESKSAIMNIIEDLIGVPRGTLVEQAGRAA